MDQSELSRIERSAVLGVSMTRQAAIARAVLELDSGAIQRDLARRVSLPTVSQAPEARSALVDYLEAEVVPALGALGFTTHLVLHDEWPFLLAERIEDATLPTVLGYSHGDVVAGMDSGWAEGLSPWVMAERDGAWFGRGTADNKGQYSINLAALQAVLETRGRLGFNAKFLIEMGEETGSPGLRNICTEHADFLRSDVLIASDGPRLSAGRPTVFLGSRGSVNFDLTINVRQGAQHSGNWGGVLADPAAQLAHAIATIVGSTGRIGLRAGVRPGFRTACALRWRASRLRSLRGAHR
jgi:acetylornithine deacetylase/succinyl-diaminopimelate desuccinylase-like protein